MSPESERCPRWLLGPSARLHRGRGQIDLTMRIPAVWTVFLLGYWALGIPLGLQATYVYP